MHEAQFKDWARAYRGWHAKDFKSWREHTIKTIPALQGIALGTLTEEEVDLLRPWLDKAHKVAGTLIKKEGQKTSKDMDFLNDVSCVRYALTHLEDWRTKGNRQIPVQKDLAIGGQSPGSSRSVVRDIETSNAAEGINGEYALLDPAFERQAETFLTECISVRKKLSQAETLTEAHLGSKYAEVLTSAARAIGLGKDIQLQAEALQYHGYWRMRELIERGKEEGTIRDRGNLNLPSSGDLNPPKKLADLGLTKTDLNHIAQLGHFSEGQFNTRLEEGIESKKLSWQMFKQPSDGKSNVPSSGDSNQQAQRSVISRDPARFTVEWAVDMRANPSYYDDIDRFSRDPRVIENLTPVAEKALKFWSLLCDRLGNTSA